MSLQSKLPLPEIAGLVLCGGKSTRMGSPKHLLPFGDEVMLQRVCRILAEVVQPIVVVAAKHQDLPELAPEVHIVRDDYDSCGPLAGIATGLAAIAELNPNKTAAFVTACDTPLLKSEFVKAIADRLNEFDSVVPTDGEHVHVLTAVYRVQLASAARKLLDSGKRRPLSLVENANSLMLPVEELRSSDPELDSLRNSNTADAYAETLRIAGLNSE
jgi:molybdopterin-guanine dinucleotide biosynthesis protein A